MLALVASDNADFKTQISYRNEDPISANPESRELKLLVHNH